MPDDDALWKCYWSADPDSAERRRLAGEIVEHHMGFIVDYARRTGQYAWNQEDRDDYLHELVAVALARVGGYRGDRGAKFVTYLSPYLRPVRWKLMGNSSAIRVGYETARLVAECDRLVAEGTTDAQAIADHLSALHGKHIGVGRVERILARPRGTSGDREVVSRAPGSALTVWDVVAAAGPSVEDEAIDNLEGVAVDVEVSVALAAADLSPLEHDVVVDRLMRVPSGRGDTGPVSCATIGLRHGVSAVEVRDTERALVVRLRGLLGHLAGEVGHDGPVQPPLPFG
jgi:hypothetical protein